MCERFRVRDSGDEFILLSLGGAEVFTGARPRTGLSARAGQGILAGKRGLVSTKGLSSTTKQLTRAEQEVQSAAERLNSQIADALAAVAARSAPGGLDELEASPDRLERAARDLAVALRELVEERQEKDKL